MDKRQTKSLIFAGLLASLICTAAAQAQDLSILTNRSPDRERLLIEGAKKEGQVVIYSAAIVNQALRPMAEAFMKKYPFVKLTYWRADTEEIVAKLSAEVRAKNVVADLVEGTGVGELAVETGLTVPFTTPATDELPEIYRDPRGNWASSRISYFGIAYNTDWCRPIRRQRHMTISSILNGRVRLLGASAHQVARLCSSPPFVCRVVKKRRRNILPNCPSRRLSISARAARARSLTA